MKLNSFSLIIKIFTQVFSNQIPNNNILESIIIIINESNLDEFWTTFILIDGEQE